MAHQNRRLGWRPVQTAVPVNDPTEADDLYQRMSTRPTAEQLERIFSNVTPLIDRRQAG